MARKKPGKKSKKPPKKKAKPLKKKEPKKKAKPKPMPEKKPAAKAPPKKIVITNKLRKIWWEARNAWEKSLGAFGVVLSRLSDEEAEMLYEVVRHSVYKGSYVEILRERPELREFVHTDEDRLFMHDTYENLSFRLGKKEPMPKYLEIRMKMKGKLGRGSSISDYVRKYAY